jgi:hypothetical protein
MITCRTDEMAGVDFIGIKRDLCFAIVTDGSFVINNNCSGNKIANTLPLGSGVNHNKSDYSEINPVEEMSYKRVSYSDVVSTLFYNT